MSPLPPPDPEKEIILEIFSHVDIESVFIVQAVTSVVRSGLNFLLPDRHTDWLAPFVALAVGLLKAYLLMGTGLEPIMYGLYLAGGAIMFQTIWSKIQTGWMVFRHKETEDPVIRAKVEKRKASSAKSKAKVKTQIDAVKKLLKRSS